MRIGRSLRVGHVFLDRFCSLRSDVRLMMIRNRSLHYDTRLAQNNKLKCGLLGSFPKLLLAERLTFTVAVTLNKPYRKSAKGSQHSNATGASALKKRCSLMMPLLRFVFFVHCLRSRPHMQIEPIAQQNRKKKQEACTGFYVKLLNWRCLRPSGARGLCNIAREPLNCDLTKIHLPNSESNPLVRHKK